MADSPRTKTLIMVLPPTPSAGVRAAELAENGYFRTAKAIRRYSTHFFNTYSIMRRSILHLAIVAIAGLSFASAQAQDGSDAPILRDNRVDTAILSRPINPKMDLSRLPLPRRTAGLLDHAARPERALQPDGLVRKPRR